MRLLRWLARWQCEGYGGWSPMFPRLADWVARRDAEARRRQHEALVAAIMGGDLSEASFGFRKRRA